MNHDLRNLAPPAMNVKVIAPGERKYRSVFCSVRYAFCLFCFVSSGHPPPPPFFLFAPFCARWSNGRARSLWMGIRVMVLYIHTLASEA